MEIDPDKLHICIETLQIISNDVASIRDNKRLKTLIAKIHAKGRRDACALVREQRQLEKRSFQQKAQIVASRNESSQLLESEACSDRFAAMKFSNTCYICKRKYTRQHFFYHMLCPECACLNYAKRGQRTDLRGKVALVTGGRVKIGYCTALRLLRDGAKVLVTTRFPVDAALRFRREPDFEEWSQRLQIFGLDFRDFESVRLFIQDLLASIEWLDILINNAAQTIKHKPAYYQYSMLREHELRKNLQPETRNLLCRDYSQAPILNIQGEADGEIVKSRRILSSILEIDSDGLFIDGSPENSWTLKLDEIDAIEMLEVLLVNVATPFMINSKMKAKLLKSQCDRRFIINVSAMEGQFSREHKTSKHPHTNMAKAGLNMMTRTSASDYAQDGIYMNSVDTGWVTDENPLHKKSHLQTKRGFYPPLDVFDAVARIYDPIVKGLLLEEQPVFGKFLKDFYPCEW